MRAIGICALVLVWTASAHAQSYGPPSYAVGDTWTLKSGEARREIRVIKMENDRVSMTGLFSECPTCVVDVDRSLAWLSVRDAAGRAIDPTPVAGFIALGDAWRYYDFPLEVKKSWRIAAYAYLRGSARRYEVDNLVEVYEDVTTPAGSFTAFRIRRSWTLIPENDPRWNTSWLDVV